MSYMMACRTRNEPLWTLAGAGSPWSVLDSHEVAVVQLYLLELTLNDVLASSALPLARPRKPSWSWVTLGPMHKTSVMCVDGRCCLAEQTLAVGGQEEEGGFEIGLRSYFPLAQLALGCTNVN